MRTTFLILSTFLLTACGDMGFETDTDSGLSTELTSPTETFDCGNLIREPGEECDSNDDLIKCVNCKLSRKIFINTNELFSGFDIGFKDLDQSCTEAAVVNPSCDNWTTDLPESSGVYGISDVITGEWTNFGLGSCGRDRHIYCVENEYIGR